MFSSILLFGLVSISQCQTESSITKYKEVPINTSSFQVVLYDTFSKQFVCGGALFSPYYAITAARCVDSSFRTLDRLKVFLAMTSLYDKSYNIVHVFIYKQFVPSNLNNRRNDIAFIKLASPIAEGLNIQYGILPDEDENIKNERPVKVFEFGETANVNRAQVVQKELNIVSWEVCRSQYQRNLFGYFITEDHVCAQNAGLESCVGSLGFPLVDTQRRIIGIVTFPFVCSDLSTTFLPAVYARAPSYSSWIHRIEEL